MRAGDDHMVDLQEILELVTRPSAHDADRVNVAQLLQHLAAFFGEHRLLRFVDNGRERAVVV